MKNDSLIQEFLHDLRGSVTGDLRTDAYSRTLYSTDASIYQVMPYGVLIPQTLEDVHAAVECAAKYHVPVLARCSGSSLEGQAINEALIIDVTRHLNNILEINTEEKWVRTQPGIVLDELNLRLRSTGLQFGPDPASSNRAAVGGIVSNNSTGAHSIMYGMTADHVLEARVILSDGSIAYFEPLTPEQLKQYRQKPGLEGKLYREIDDLVTEHVEIIRAGTPHHWRRVSGYNLDRLVNDGVHFLAPQDSRFNLAKLISGGEGTLGIFTEVKLNLVDIPKMTALAIVQFPSLHEALAAIPTMLETSPSAIELLDNVALTMCKDVPQYARLLKTFLEGEPDCILITEFYGDSESELRGKIDHLRNYMRQQGIPVTAVTPIIEPQRQKDVWTVRKVGLGLLMSIKGDFKPLPFIEDSAVPPEHLAEYVDKICAFCAERNTAVACYAHASAGCIHIRPMINLKLARDLVKMTDLSRFALELVKGYDGALSSEHGDGRTRTWLNERFFGPELYGLYRQVKHIFDPERIFNPGMIVDGQQMTEHLRYGDTYQVIPIQPHFDFSYEHGFDLAVEMCNGAGVCRKRTEGTMCPSFMVTQDEEHSTRGRANALRAAMSGVLPAAEFTSPRMYAVMDLCISCKACKAECPSSVDMGKIKFEFLAQYHDTHGIPLRSRVFGDIARLSRLSSGWLAPLVNWGLHNPLIRVGMERVMGISRQHSLPTFARQPFTAWFKKHTPRLSTDGKRRQVVLFNDTFNTYNYPQVSIAATEVLEVAGFEVVLPGHKCCGRPMISKGLVGEARAAAQDTVERLAPFARQEIPIVGLEPSCLLTLRDEYLYLLPDHPDVKIVAQNAYLFEEFMAKLADAGELNLSFTNQQRQLLLHGHCHQKALVGTNPSKKTLTLPTNYTVQEVDSGCCGMAGSFGYEVEHYDISIQIGEQRLLPAVREAAPETIIVAAGVSCRQQIKHGTGKQALHPAEVLRDAIK